YGMNFEYMPELKWRFGYPAVLIAMGIIVVVMLLWFGRKGWLRSDPDPASDDSRRTARLSGWRAGRFFV
ncbi:MAG: hypothetical protein H7Y12_00965, partial [Sphingobacteriaceae bacterium]|nr:hypothetical protein [Cytophagaceae bacterium]